MLVNRVSQVLLYSIVIYASLGYSLGYNVMNDHPIRMHLIGEANRAQASPESLSALGVQVSLRP